VASVRNEGDYGLYVLLYNQQSGVTTMYSHLAKALVGNGQAVAAGQTVGTLAASGGGSKGTLHFGWQVRDVSNPAYGDWLDPMFGRMLNG
jgi:murein DD-endopeptidase MepM/ murein hydrolase activator NlpD